VAGTTDMGLGPCDDLAQTVASLERHVDRLQEILAEPDLSPAVRLSIIRQIGEAQRTIASLSDALVRCRAPLSIEGIELTQATQYFAFNGQGSGHAPDNSVPLIALRTLVARVYTDSKWVQSLPLPSFPTYVNGRITVDRFNTNGSVTRVADLKPINGPIAARRAATIDRGDPDHTLNFRLAAADCQGLLRFTVVVFQQGPVVSDNVAAGNPRATATQRLDAGTSEPAGPAGIQAAERPSFTVHVYGRFEPVPAFRVRGVLIHYTGDGMDVPAPTGLDFAKTLEFVTKTYPIGRLEFADCVEVEFNGDLSAPGGGCGPGWEGPNGLLGLLANLASGSDDPAIYIALVPRGASSPYTAGCGNTGVAAAFDGAGATLAQEVGHALSRKHAPACGAGGPDPGYPTYDGYPSGSIGEFGFDPFTSDVYDPARYSDFMGYCPDRWVSPYTYMALRDAIVTRFGARARRRLQAGEPPETLFLHFRVHREGAVEVGPGLHLPQVHGTVDQTRRQTSAASCLTATALSSCSIGADNASPTRTRTARTSISTKLFPGSTRPRQFASCETDRSCTFTRSNRALRRLSCARRNFSTARVPSAWNGAHGSQRIGLPTWCATATTVGIAGVPWPRTFATPRARCSRTCCPVEIGALCRSWRHPVFERL
jgi:hypothetical protein